MTYKCPQRKCSSYRTVQADVDGIFQNCELAAARPIWPSFSVEGRIDSWVEVSETPGRSSAKGDHTLWPRRLELFEVETFDELRSGSFQGSCFWFASFPSFSGFIPSARAI